MKGRPKSLEKGTIDLIKRFQEDCALRGLASTTDYIYRVKEFCTFLEARGINPLKVTREDLKAFLGYLK